MSQATAASLHRQSLELNIFHDVAKALTSSLDLDSILQTIMEKMAEYFRPENWWGHNIPSGSRRLQSATGRAHGQRSELPARATKYFGWPANDDEYPNWRPCGHR